MASTSIGDGRFINTSRAYQRESHLKESQAADADTMEGYYQAVLHALEELIQQHDLLTHKQINLREQAWKEAYLSTPHGQPVKLNEAHNE